MHASATARADEAAQPTVSVIVPVYNAGRYLDQALVSIESQTLRSLEVICVDDGSTDDSATIMRRHAAQDPRLRMIAKPNGGYGSACNRGLAEARGTWIAIVEPDDWIEPDMYRAMVAHAESLDVAPDMVKTPYWRIWLPDTPRQRRVNCSYRKRIRPAVQPFAFSGDPSVVHLVEHHPSIWSALYRADFLKRCGITFREIPGAGWADNPFLVETLCQARSIAYLDEPFYNYREETPEKAAAFARDGWRTALDRWHDMLDVYERLGVVDESLARAHIRRGITYLSGILEQHSPDEPELREAMRTLFDRMDAHLLFSDSRIAPGMKALYADVMGRSVPDGADRRAPYLSFVMREGIYNVVNTGPGMTLETLRSFLG